MKKILNLNDLDNDFNSTKEKIVLCYGHFNTLHPGHFRYFDYAHKFGDKLYVLLQSDLEIEKHLRSHYFSTYQRATALSQIEKINGVILYENKLLQTLKKIKANYLVLGKEHENSTTPQILKAVKAFRKSGGKVIFHAGDIVYADSKLDYPQNENITEKRNLDFLKVLSKNKIDKQRLIEIIKKINKTKLLVIGDTIIDKYIACDALGMSAEAPLVVFRELHSKNYIGGAAIVANHIKRLGADCKFISIIGNDNEGKLALEFLKKAKIKNKIFVDQTRPTTFKTRYMVNKQKVFRASRLKDHSIPMSLENKIISEITKKSNNYQGILVSDFVYGLITPNLINAIQEFSHNKDIPVFADVQSSSQYGNILKFQNVELLCPNEREARIALGNNDDSLEKVAQQILKKSRSKKLILKLGSNGFISYDLKKYGHIEREHFPALTIDPLDETGAGDSLLSAITACLTVGASLKEASAIATYMSSLSVQTIGNKPIGKETLIKEILK